MSYGLLVTLHLFCAIVFIGIVSFEVLILEGIRKNLPPPYMTLVEEGIHHRGRKLMPWFVATLFLSGIAMALGTHRHALLGALGGTADSLFGLLLSIKILLAVSVLVHFVVAIRYSLCGGMSNKRFKYTHLSVFIHMVLIVLLAKGMYYPPAWARFSN
ncbi:hypothetical protein HNP55_003834 [Paucibacter oligotrophus]|uniref:Copper resistance protein D n=1 Tax=Roseateles oligotrophus TaxID=1769250 RepID=A0A840LJ36_9BURK|nr:hypothetical protein [Roseateles oligotrophus]